MTALAAPTRVQPRPVRTHPTNIARQSWIMVKRNMIHTKRMPEMLSDVTVQPVMFVLLFAFVFGASITNTGGASYREFLLPGIQAQTIVFSAFVVASGITADIEKGIIDRFRSLPISRSSVLIGRSIASLIHSSLGIVVMAVTGLAIGWRIRGSVAEAALAFALVLLFGFGMIWFGILIGSLLRTVEAVNGVMFTLLFPVTFLANTFVPTEPMPHWLRVMAEWNPVSSLAQAMRELWGNGGPAPASAQLPLHHPVLATILWLLALTAIFAPFALRAYARRTADRNRFAGSAAWRAWRTMMERIVSRMATGAAIIVSICSDSAITRSLRNGGLRWGRSPSGCTPSTRPSRGRLPRSAPDRGVRRLRSAWLPASAVSRRLPATSVRNGRSPTSRPSSEPGVARHSPTRTRPHPSPDMPRLISPTRSTARSPG